MHIFASVAWHAKLGNVVKSHLLLIYTLITLFLLCGNRAEAVQEKSAHRVVRVGCVDIDRFFETTPNGAVHGFGADFLEELAQYTGWRYEYVPGSWAESLSRLKNGEIDLLFPAEHSRERDRWFLFSEESCSMDFAALYTREDNNNLGYEDYDSFNGMTVGMIRDNQLNESFNIFLKSKNIRVKRVYFSEVEDMKATLRGGGLDAVVYGVMNEDPHQKLLAKFRYTRTYFITSKNNPALMAELNSALRQLLLRNPYFPAKLYDRHYQDPDRQSVSYTLKEMAYIQKSPPISVACDTDSYPIEWYNEASGRYEGIYPDILRKIEAYSGLKFLFLPPGQASPWASLASKTSFLLGSAVDNPILREKHGMTCTDSYFTARYSLVGARGFSFDRAQPHTVAVQKDQIGTQYLLMLQYPHWRILPQASVKDSLRAVSRGEADLACVHGVTLQVDPNLALPDKLTTIYTAALEVPVSIGIGRDQEDLLIILNKAIHKLSKRDIEQAVLANTLEAKQKISISSFVLHFPKTSLFFASFLSALLFFFIFMAYRNRWHQKQNSILEKSYSQLQEVTRQREELRMRAETDTLTGLYHKGAFRRRAEWLLSPGAHYALLFFDMDNFKILNDRYGHLAGDEALMEVARILRRNFRGEDVAGRFGGDEFFVFAPVASPAIPLQRAAAVVREIATYHTAKGRDPDAFTMCVGIAMSPEHGTTFDELLAHADEALYRAKKKGRNRMEFYAPTSAPQGDAD